MPCPYLTRVTMFTCRGSPVRVYVPSDRMSPGSACEGDCFAACPVFRESAEGAEREVRAWQRERDLPRRAGAKGGGL